MADQAKLTIRVSSGKTASTVAVATTGRYRGLATNTVRFELLGEPMFTTADALHYWNAVLAVVQAQIVALGG